jgi:hypothetical protein
MIATVMHSSEAREHRRPLPHFPQVLEVLALQSALSALFLSASPPDLRCRHETILLLDGRHSCPSPRVTPTRNVSLTTGQLTRPEGITPVSNGNMAREGWSPSRFITRCKTLLPLERGRLGGGGSFASLGVMPLSRRPK